MLTFGLVCFDGAMDFPRLHECLREDFRLLRAAVERSDAKARVPSCPDWTVADLAEHVAKVYMHKAECIRLGAFPDEWPREIPTDPVAALDENFAELENQFAAHSPGDHAATWHEPDQTVGFWIRRMAQETVIHRIDAELGAGTAVTPVPDDLALDGIDEHLKLFLGYGSIAWADEIGELLSAPDERPILVHTDNGASWTVSAHPTGITAADFEDGEAAGPADFALTVSGSPEAVLRWLWNRSQDGPQASVCGDPLLLAQFQGITVALTQ
ncbi:MAG TPA: maleylpyruvate isomerase family mycothiol-dependent enzyme [Actinocrinis sp.]|uniref:maleylpyruvate isomerase family mycothiol-dependent enzyme n=1 Tax=Actinocrinis sp. TaxID=1920516 RepID=UPI002D2D3271|nr:maleylpyruvate isomerase family mycothiol-dependent enzyme [Actinocrinis sp.]HZU55577.1 maleylpyruvate isomerase family mycothiol-dependent enzyme [Actinocrinis sp.]